jgi:hypothetical protein
MLDILKFAHEKGAEQGEKKGEEKGSLQTAREMLIEILKESLGIVPAYIADEVTAISRPDILKGLVKQAVKCREISEFEKMLRLATKQAAG